MKMLSQPRLVESRVGQTWLAAGFRIFHRQPLAWTMILFIYWAAMLMLAFIPIAGMVLPLLLSPGLAMGFIEIACAIDEKRTPSPTLLISAFRSTQGRAVLMLGVWYVIEVLAILLITVLIDGGLMMEWIAVGKLPEPDQMAQIQTSALIAAVLYIPVLMAFWFAPQLVVWSGFTPTKALFYSFFAVWRNKGAFIRYLITWIALTLAVGGVIALIGQSLEMAANTMTAMLFPITLILMSVAHGSFYQSTKAIFGDTDVTPSDSAWDSSSDATSNPSSNSLPNPGDRDSDRI